MFFLLTLVAVAVTPAVAFDNVTPQEAYELVASRPNVYILDVRTPEEWSWVGHPGENKLGEGAPLQGKVFNISYLVRGKDGLEPNNSFLNDVKEAFKNVPDVILVTMCRSGKRSEAAATALETAGYMVKNMLTGFEGGKDARGYRSVNGWVNDGLSYNYGAGAYPD